MTDLGAVFLELGLEHYIDIFLEHGFDSWDSLLDITESDFDTLGVKLGHRRKLQRKIANVRGGSIDNPLRSPKRTTPFDDRLEESKTAISKADSRTGATSSGKRKYRRHPKPDEHAPERPPSAYVIFSNKMRDDLRGRNLSFTEIAKLVGENWQNLSAGGKEPYEAQAFSAKEKYNCALIEYKKTDEYKRYSEYLSDFKTKQATQQQGKLGSVASPNHNLTTAATADAAKRPKLDNQHSNGSSTTGDSVTSPLGADHSTGHARLNSIGSASMGSGHEFSAPISHMQNSVINQGTPLIHLQHNSAFSSHAPLPGYRDIVIGSAQPALAWREQARESNVLNFPQYPRISNSDDRRSSLTSLAQSPLDSIGHPRRPLGFNGALLPPSSTPPLLTAESSGGTSMSAGSSNSAAAMLYGPRTPLEPSVGGSLATAPLLSAKSLISFDTQLPPIRQTSQSPQSSLNLPYTSPAGTDSSEISAMDARRSYHVPLHSVRASSPVSSHFPFKSNIAHPRSQLPRNDEALEGVSALLRAGEMVDRDIQSRALPK